MEASTVTRAAPPDPVPEHDGQAEATRSTTELFQWSTYVDVGEGAADCPHGHDGACDVKSHFHAWLCLPNVFQARDITEKANAARARKRRSLLQDGKAGGEASDSNVIMEDELTIWTVNDSTWEALVATIANRNVEKQLPEIVDELNDSDRFEHHDADVEEYQRLVRLAEEERDPEDWKRLEADIEAYRQALDDGAKARYERECQVLRQAKRDDLLDMQRQHVVDRKSQDVWFHIYYTWAYYTCAKVPVRKGYPAKRVFEKPEDLRNTSPEIVDALRDAYTDLESRMLLRSDATGN